MEKTTLELVGQWSAYIVVILAAFSKVISEILTFKLDLTKFTFKGIDSFPSKHTRYNFGWATDGASESIYIRD